MSEIVLNNVSLKYPIYAESTRSLKRDIVNMLILKKKDVNRKLITCVNALNNISLHLKSGDSVGLIGHNGAGKTTLLKVLSGIYTVTEGTIRVEGSISSVLSGSAVGMQPELTGYENIKLSAMIRGYSKQEAENIKTDVEQFTELGDFLSLPVKIYSSGMQARLAFGISTAIFPDILLLDEVVGAGDARFINKAKERMDVLVKKANILVLASHSTEILQQFCNKVLWLDHGRIRGFGSAEDVLHEYLSEVAASV